MKYRKSIEMCGEIFHLYWQDLCTKSLDTVSLEVFVLVIFDENFQNMIQINLNCQ
jgi:hypothetical protein